MLRFLERLFFVSIEILSFTLCMTMSTLMHCSEIPFADNLPRAHSMSCRFSSTSISRTPCSTRKINTHAFKRHRISLRTILNLASVLGFVFFSQGALATATLRSANLEGTEEANFTTAVPIIHATGSEMSVGSDCSGSEGQWNCLTNSWQRCASQRWSVVMQCADGTICSPSGLSYDFHVEASNSGGTSSGGGVGNAARGYGWPKQWLAGISLVTVLLSKSI